MCYWASSTNGNLMKIGWLVLPHCSSMVCARLCCDFSTAEPRLKSFWKRPPLLITITKHWIASEISFCSYMLTFLHELSLNWQGTAALIWGTSGSEGISVAASILLTSNVRRSHTAPLPPQVRAAPADSLGGACNSWPQGWVQAPRWA